MQLDEKTQFLIAVGAAIAAECEACFQTCRAIALGCGADERDIRTAMAIGRRIMRCAARQGTKPPSQSPAAQDQSEPCC